MIDKYLHLAVKASELAGEFLMKRDNITIDIDEARDIKLSTDKDSEKIIFDTLAPSGLGILSEEFGVAGSIEGLHWIVDPLDGTVNYFRGMHELSCISIALWDGETPVLGVINRFAAKELFIGIVGQGATLNRSKIHTSQIQSVKNAILTTGFPIGRDYGEDSLRAFIKNVQSAKKIRMLGAAAVMGAFVACGRSDIYTEDSIRLWDVAAVAAIVLAAGGCYRMKMVSDDYKCNFAAFANATLMESYYV